MKIEKFKVLLYLKKSAPDKLGNIPIMGRITVDDSISQISCKLSCKLELWNARASRMSGKSKVAVETNAKIDKLLLSINDAYTTLQDRKQPFNAEDVKNLFQGVATTQMTLLKAYDCCMEDLRKRIGIDRNAKTIYKYVSTRKVLVAFIKKKFKSKDVLFSQLNEQFIREFQDYSILVCKRANDTMRHDLALLKKACTYAFRQGCSDRHYFAHYKLPKQKESTPKALSKEQFEAIKNLEIAPHRKSHIQTRDMFIFSCYTGVPYIDVVAISKEHLSLDYTGAMWLKFQRGKNGMLCRIKLLPEAIEIIEKYRSEERETIFPMQIYATVGSNMRSFKVMLGIKGAFSYHMSRHSFSTLVTLEQGVPIETVSLMLGHSDISTTQIYAKVTPQKLFEDMEIFIDYTKDLKLVL